MRTTNQALDSAQNSLRNRGYSRNFAGNILVQNTEQGNYAYDYDSIDQLTNVSVSGYSGPSGMATNESFAYDLMGNRLWSTLNAEPGTLNASTYSANNLNQYLSVTSVVSVRAYSYDQNGNQLVNYQELSDGSIITNCLGWDIENRLVSITNQDGEVGQYTYDPFGKRLSKAVNGITNYYVYSDEGLIAELDSTGGVAVAYGYQPDSLWMNNPVFLSKPGPENPELRTYYYFANDHLGAPQKLVAKNGSTVWSLVQDAFGMAVVSSNSTVLCNLRFSSQYHDEESGLNNNDQRYFDPVNGRYLSGDQIGDAAIFNLYGFVDNDTVDYVDPDGRAKYRPTSGGSEDAGYSDTWPAGVPHWVARNKSATPNSIQCLGGGVGICVEESSDPIVNKCITECTKKHEICHARQAAPDHPCIGKEDGLQVGVNFDGVPRFLARRYYCRAEVECHKAHLTCLQSKKRDSACKCLIDAEIKRVEDNLKKLINECGK